jgi:hypothetical protein
MVALETRIKAKKNDEFIYIEKKRNDEKKVSEDREQQNK